MSTIFSQIIAGEIPSYKIHEDDKTFAFLDIHPETKGHILVVPKLEVDKVYDLPDDYYDALMRAARDLCRRVEEVYGTRAIMKVIGTDVPHSHVHVMPLSSDWVYGRTLDLPAEEMATIAAKLAF